MSGTLEPSQLATQELNQGSQRIKRSICKYTLSSLNLPTYLYFRQNPTLEGTQNPVADWMINSIYLKNQAECDECCLLSDGGLKTMDTFSPKSKTILLPEAAS